jgi:hypothetical protein
MNIEQAKTIRIDEFLENLGYICAKETGARKWYKFRDEKTASFVVSKDGMAWYDHGDGIGGNIIDVAKIAANSDSVSEALKFIENTVGSSYSFTIRQTIPVQPAEPYYSVVYDADFSIYKGRYLSPAALYLKERRGISPEAVYPYFRDVFHISSQQQKKPFYAFGIPNISGGFEGRTFFHGQWHKRTIGNKDVSVFTTEKENAPWQCFYSMMDFSTFLTKYDAEKRGDNNYLILNGDGMIDNARAYLETRPPGYMIHYPHNDESGKKAYQRMLDDVLIPLGWDGGEGSYLYEGSKDWNEKHQTADHRQGHEAARADSQPNRHYRNNKTGKRSRGHNGHITAHSASYHKCPAR